MNKSFLLAFVSIATYTSEPKSPQTPVVKPLHQAHELLRGDLCNLSILSYLKQSIAEKPSRNSNFLESYTCKLGSKNDSDVLIGNRSEKGIACYIITLSRENGLSTQVNPAHPDLFFSMRENYNKKRQKKNNLTILSK